MKKYQLLKDFRRVKKIANMNINVLKEILEENKEQSGNVIINGRTLGCVTLRYQLKCKSSNCFLIQKEIGRNEIGHQRCHACHLAFLNEAEGEKIKIRK